MSIRWAQVKLAGVKLSAMAGVMAMTAPAIAQSVPGGTPAAADTPQDNKIVDIVVTAQKRSESLSKVPMSITVASGEQLRAAGITSVGDLQKVVSGFRYTTSDYATPIFSIRGVGFNESSLGAMPNVSVYIDEVPLPLSILTRGTNLDVDRVEVLKGPQGTLFGSNTTGGAINFIAAKPGDHFQAGLDATYGRFNQADISGFVSGPLTDTLGARVAVSTSQGGDWQRSYTRNDKRGRNDLSNGRVLLDWKPAAGVKFELAVSHLFDGGDEQAAQLIAVTPLAPASIGLIPQIVSYPLAPANDRAADWDAGIAFRRHDLQTQVSLRGEAQVGDATLTSITSYIHYTQNSHDDPDGTSLQNLEYLTSAYSKSFSQELRLSGKSGPVKWVVGGNYANVKVDQIDTGQSSYDTNVYALGPTNYFADYFNSSYQTFDTIAGFGGVDVALTSMLTANASARYTRTKIDFAGCTGDTGDNELASGWNAAFGTDVQPGGCVTLSPTFQAGMASSTLDQHNVSWHGGLDYKPGANMLIYASVSRGYKAGSYPILSASSASQLTPVSQETVTAYEAGFKATLADRTLQLSGAVFYYDYSDKQVRGRVSVPVFGPLEALVNVPKSRVAGAELQALWKPMRGLTLNLSGTYADSKILDGFTNYNAYGVLQNFSGEAFPLTSKFQGDADVAYEFPLRVGLDGFVGANLNDQSATNGALGALPLLNIRAYALLDLRAGVKSADGAWRFSIWGRNVTNTYYWTIADHIADTTVRYAGRPATFGATLSIRVN